MSELYILVEGTTEEAFVKDVLAPHFQPLAIYAIPIIVQTSRTARGRKNKGGGRWAHWYNDLRKLLAQHTRPGAHFSTMFDLYGLPCDFPSLDECRTVGDTAVRIQRLEAAMAAAVKDPRLIPYLQRHEFEALVLAGLNELAALLEAEQRHQLDALRVDLGGVLPEDVNDGPSTAPSKRLARIDGYRKPLHGPLVTQATGLAALRAACPRFDAWVTRLEQLAR